MLKVAISGLFYNTHTSLFNTVYITVVRFMSCVFIFSIAEFL